MRISQEMMEMEMMDRQFQSQMFMGMDPLERRSSPWEMGCQPRGVRGNRGGMMGRGRGGAVRGRLDMDYLAYSDGHYPHTPSPHGRGPRGGRSRPGTTRGGVKERLGHSPDKAINPLFDDLYEQPQSTPVRQSTFERARHKVDTGSPGSYQGPQLGGPPQKTWSN